MKKILISACAALFINQTPVLAEDFGGSDLLDSTQIGVGIGSLDMNLNDSGVLFYVSAQKELDMILGDFDSFGVVRFGSSTAAKTGATESKLKFIASGLFKANFPLQNNTNIYGLAGFSASQVSIESNDSFGDLSFSYGFGWNTNLSDQMNIGVEYVEYSTRATAFAVNAAYKF